MRAAVGQIAKVEHSFSVFCDVYFPDENSGIKEYFKFYDTLTLNVSPVEKAKKIELFDFFLNKSSDRYYTKSLNT